MRLNRRAAPYVLSVAAARSASPPPRITRRPNQPDRGKDYAIDRFAAHKAQDLPTAATDLREASIARKFDRDLLGITFPAQLETVGHRLVRTNEARAALALQVTTSTSHITLSSSGPAQATADAEVEDQVRMLRRRLALPTSDQN